MGSFWLVKIKTKAMKEIRLIITILFFTMGCSSMRNMQKINFKYNDLHERHRLILSIPQNYSLQRIKADGEAGTENRYWYSDSAVIYISTFKGGSSLNYKNIRKQEGAYAKRFESDTVTLSGINESGKYWKEVKYHSLYYGYSNVKADEKKSFDRAISSVKIK